MFIGYLLFFFCELLVSLVSILPPRPQSKVILWQHHLCLDLLWVNTKKTHGLDDQWVSHSGFWISMAPLRLSLAVGSEQIATQLGTFGHTLHFATFILTAHPIFYMHFGPLYTPTLPTGLCLLQGKNPTWWTFIYLISLVFNRYSYSCWIKVYWWQWTQAQRDPEPWKGTAGPLLSKVGADSTRSAWSSTVTFCLAPKNWFPEPEAECPCNKTDKRNKKERQVIASQKKEWSTDTFSNRDEPWKTVCNVKEARHKGPHVAWFHLYEVFRLGKPIETGSRLVVARSWGKGENGKWLLMGQDFFLGW